MSKPPSYFLEDIIFIYDPPTPLLLDWYCLGKNLSLAMSCTLMGKISVYIVEALVSEHHGNLKK